MNKHLILQNIPCTLVTGFLGSGKTTIINHLLSTKAIDDRWALLINEFGRIGIDGAILKNTVNDKDVDSENVDSTIAIGEVSGGCICCTSQLPLQIALTRLLTDHRPERLIIEPTGLAHPRELLRQLSAEHWQTALSMQAVIAVLNSIQWQQEKYRTHNGFQAHIIAADVVVINRFEQLSNACKHNLQEWIRSLNKHAQIIWATSDHQTATDHSSTLEAFNTYLSELSAQLSKSSPSISQQRTANAVQSRVNLTPLNKLTAGLPTITSNKSKSDKLPYRYYDEQLGMQVGGWRLPASWIFDAAGLQEWLLTLPNWQRIKGIVHTSDGWLNINLTPDSLTINPTNAQTESRLEVILEPNNMNSKKDNWAVWDTSLMALVID